MDITAAGTGITPDKAFTQHPSITKITLTATRFDLLLLRNRTCARVAARLTAEEGIDAPAACGSRTAASCTPSDQAVAAGTGTDRDGSRPARRAADTQPGASEPPSRVGHRAPSPGARRSGDTAPRAALAIVPPADLRGASQDGPGGTRSAAVPKPRRTRRPGDAARRATPAIEPPADLLGAGHDGPGGAGSAATNT